MDLEQAKRLYSEAIIDNPKGALCPCCLRPGKAYRRNINPDQARFLLHFYQEYGQQWGNSQDLRRKWTGLDGREESKLRYWMLFEPKDDNSRSKEWRITDLGVAFILEEVAIPKYVYVLDNEVVKHEGPDLHISAMMAKKYDYNSLAL